MGRLTEDFKQKVVDGFYNTHPKGDMLLEVDFDEVKREILTESQFDYLREKENSPNSSKLL